MRPASPGCSSLTALILILAGLANAVHSGPPLPGPGIGSTVGPPTRLPGASRIVAIGDLHGDLRAMREALGLAGVLDASDRWTGGSTVVVQLGDQLDRGDDEFAILELTRKLTADAAAAGGGFHALNGNHEVMNADGDFRYVTPGGIESACVHDPGRDRSAPCDGAASRRRLFAPGGLLGRELAMRPTVLIVGETLFVHGGVLPGHVSAGLESINEGISAWLRGEGARPAHLDREDSPVWTRLFSAGDTPDCALLTRVLEAARVRRMVVAHTVQVRGINGVCEGRLWRIDVGLSRAYGGPVEVLEIVGETVRVLRAGATAGDPPR